MCIIGLAMNKKYQSRNKSWYNYWKIPKILRLNGSSFGLKPIKLKVCCTSWRISIVLNEHEIQILFKKRVENSQYLIQKKMNKKKHMKDFQLQEIVIDCSLAMVNTVYLEFNTLYSKLKVKSNFPHVSHAHVSVIALD